MPGSRGPAHTFARYSSCLARASFLGSGRRCYPALRQGYDGIVTVDGNGKDDIETIPRFVAELEAGYDLIQGSRYMPGGQAIRTPWLRTLAIRFVDAPLISFASGFRYTDTTNGFRGYSCRFLLDPRVQPFRKDFHTYELLAYLSIRGPQLGYKVREIPVTRQYPQDGKIPTKITSLMGKLGILLILVKAISGRFNPGPSWANAWAPHGC